MMSSCCEVRHWVHNWKTNESFKYTKYTWYVIELLKLLPGCANAQTVAQFKSKERTR